MTTPKIGLIVPPSGDIVPPEAHQLFPQGVEFVARGLDIKNMAAADFLIALESLEEKARELKALDVDAITVLGTSLTFFRGQEGNAEVIERLQAVAPDIPVTTLSTSLVRRLKQHNAQRIAVIGAYETQMSLKLLAFLEDHGFDVVNRTELGLVSMQSVAEMNEGGLQEKIVEIVKNFETEPDAIVISCGGLRTFDLADELAAFTAAPIVSSSVDGVIDVADLVGVEYSRA